MAGSTGSRGVAVVAGVTQAPTAGLCSRAGRHAGQTRTTRAACRARGKACHTEAHPIVVVARVAWTASAAQCPEIRGVAAHAGRVRAGGASQARVMASRAGG